MKKRIYAIALILYISFLFLISSGAEEAKSTPVVHLTAYDSANKVVGEGSACLMFDNRTLVTNFRTIQNASMVIAQSSDGYQYLANKVLILSVEKDIAILRAMSPLNAEPAAYDAADPKSGNSVTLLADDFTETKVSISEMYKRNDTALIKLKADNKAGAVLDESGKVVAITSAFFDEGKDSDAAIDIDEVVALYEKWNGSEFDVANQMNARFLSQDFMDGRKVYYGADSSFYIDLEKDEETVFAGKTFRITPKVVAFDGGSAKNSGFVWTTADEGVAKVSTSGTVTGVKAGDVIITCTSKTDENVYSCMVVHVHEPVKAVKMSESSVKLLVGAYSDSKSSAKLSASIEPANAYYKGVEWKSSNTNVAVVDQNGRVTAKGTGTCTITAVSTEEGTSSPKKATCSVSVSRGVQWIEDSKGKTSTTIRCGRSETLSAKAYPSNAANKKLIWKSSNESIAKVSTNGTVTAVSPGSCQITCTAADGGGASRTYTVYTEQLVTKLTASGDTRLGYYEGATVTLSVNCTPYNASNRFITWKISDTSIAQSVNSSGILFDNQNSKKFTFKKPGRCKITASTTDGSNKSVTFDIWVYPKAGTPTLYMDYDTYATWDDASNNKLKIRFQVKNMETAKKVSAFELYVYAENAWGSRIYGSNQIYKWTTTREVGPGKKVYSDYVLLPNRNEIFNVHCGIHKIRYEDGSVVTIDDVDYWYWTID